MPMITTDDDDDDDDEFIIQDKSGSSEDTDDTDLSNSDGDEDEGSLNGNAIDSDKNCDSSIAVSESDDNEMPKLTKEKNFCEISSVSSDHRNLQGKRPLICSLCLNLRPSVKKDRVIQCKRCGVAVHENCYLTDGLVQLPNSSNSVAPIWFCEPCLYGLREPPYCEFCPSRYGAFKKADIGGGWVHLLCGLYTPSVTFGDVDHLSAISWQEMDYKSFGRKACAACPDPVTARTGITVACDAGLCKAFYHISCAQRLGLLVDNSENHALKQKAYGNTGTNSSDWYISDEEIADTYYLTCRRHCVDEDAVRRRKIACSYFYKQEEARMANLNRRASTLNDSDEKARLAILAKHRAAMKDLEGVTIAWPEDERKNVRYLHNSPKFLQLFLEKAESEGVEKVNFLREFSRLDGSKLSYLPPAFTKEFISYFEARENSIIPEELEEQNKLEKEIASLRSQQKKLENDVLEAQKTSAKDNFNATLQTLNLWYSLLVRLGAKKIKNPEIIIGVKDFEKPKKSIVRAKRSLVGEHTSGAEANSSPYSNNKPVLSTEVPLQTNICDTCQKNVIPLQTTDQHLLVYCDFCKKHFHLACLDPPLTKMPKLGRNHVWMCSNCGQSSDEEDSSEENLKLAAEESSRPVLRDRSSMAEKRRLEQEEQLRAFRQATRLRNSSWKRKRSLPTPKKKTTGQQTLKPPSIVGSLSITVPNATSVQGQLRTFSPPGKKLRSQISGSSLPNGFVRNVAHPSVTALCNVSLKAKDVSADGALKRRGSTVSPVVSRGKSDFKQR
uniref:PHD-type domain-containing protein n=1 Tax=Syphacia muris TaxID=451379 RepID=A0A0N5AX33_9BILA